MEKELNHLITALRALGWTGFLTRDPGVILVPHGPGWGAGRYIFMRADYIAKLGWEKALVEAHRLAVIPPAGPPL